MGLIEFGLLSLLWLSTDLKFSKVIIALVVTIGLVSIHYISYDSFNKAGDCLFDGIYE